MEGQLPLSNSQYPCQSAPWSRLTRHNAGDSAISTPDVPHRPHLSSHLSSPTLHLLPKQHPPVDLAFQQAQLAQYNDRLGLSGRPSHSLDPQYIPAVPGSGCPADSSITENHVKSDRGAGNGNRGQRNLNPGERAHIAGVKAATMPSKKTDSGDLHVHKTGRPHTQSQNLIFSNSVPSTPQQHARKFSFESREPSPTSTHSHSPRSAYSESNVTLPSRPSAFPSQVTKCRYETAQSGFKRRIPYSVGGEKLDALRPEEVKNRLSKDEERILESDSRKLYSVLLPTKESEHKRQRLVEKLETMFNAEWPGHNIRVHMFGSSGNMLCTDKSDVDICITTDPWPEMDRICPIADLLAKNGMEKVICISTAKIPIVKIWDPELELACDMNLNNPLALENTRMIKTYVQIDERVRPLAMIIKHWTKQRVVNDAGFGFTLSSYTWICMIINFLQSRSPPILPALHQRPHMVVPRKAGVQPSSFADDLTALRDFGSPNTESLSQLLFHFFRFYAHEFDYENLVLSVRSGRQITKVDKGWQHTNNNRLCVEEPFNLGRNLANTADDISFRGLHLELRRAFDLISAANLDECCAQYEFPKEVDRSQARASQKPKPIPVLVPQPAKSSETPHRSASTHSGRGGNHSRGGRNGGYKGQKGHGGGRRASSSSGFDISHYMPNNPAQHAWLQSQAQSRLHNDLYTTYTVLQAQENSLRLQLYAQGLQNQAYAQAQGNGTQPKQQTADRHRGNSIDQPPLTAPLVRQGDMFYHPAPMYGYQAPSTNPSSPSLSNAVPDLRRSLHRQSVANGAAPSNGPIPNSSLRSQSQPASRSGPSPLSGQGPGMTNPGLGIYPQPYRQPLGVPIPNFIADENVEPSTESYSSHATTPPSEDVSSKEYVGYYVHPHDPSPMRRQSAMLVPIPAFGDLNQPSRRLSTDRLPQSVLDIMKRPGSRSPSPLGHDRSFSAGVQSAPLTAVPSQQANTNSSQKSPYSQGPLVVNGSYPIPVSIPNWRASVTADSPPGAPHRDVAFGSMDSVSQHSCASSDIFLLDEQNPFGQRTPRDNVSESPMQRPMIVNGSTSMANGSTSEAAWPEMPSESPIYSNPLSDGPSVYEQTNGIAPRLSPKSHHRLARQAHSSGIPPLDIAQGQIEPSKDTLSNLSPVLETRTPSPSVNRKFEPALDRKINSNSNKGNKEKNESSKVGQVQGTFSGALTKSNLAPPITNGHTRSSKSEGSAGAWQQAKGSRKKASADKANGGSLQQSEKPPRNENERKGG